METKYQGVVSDRLSDEEHRTRIVDSRETAYQRAHALGTRYGLNSTGRAEYHVYAVVDGQAVDDYGQPV